MPKPSSLVWHGVHCDLYPAHHHFFVGPEIIVGAATGESGLPAIVLGVLFIILVGAFFMPFLLNYGAIEFVGALLEPLMRPLFKIPGKAALDATASFVSSSSLAVIITSRLYRQKVYTKREAVAVATCFSAVSIGFAYLVISTAGVAQHFTAIYLISFITAFIISAIVVRIPPISRKPDVYYDETPKPKKSGKPTPILTRTSCAAAEAGLSNGLSLQTLCPKTSSSA